MAALPPEYRHEPALGLAGGIEGIDLVERMLAALPGRLAAAGLFVCEVGASAPALLRAHPELPFIWPELPAGGEGVFLLFAEDLAPIG
jgi:ribosomal protein L3 glutamine methyltransferase